MDLNEANKLWFEFKPIEGVKFGLNDTIRVVKGKHSGNYGSVISLLSLQPVTYLIELDLTKDCDVVISETDIENAE